MTNVWEDLQAFLGFPVLDCIEGEVLRVEYNNDLLLTKVDFKDGRFKRFNNISPRTIPVGKRVWIKFDKLSGKIIDVDVNY